MTDVERAPYPLAADEPIFDHDPRVTRALMDRLRSEGRELVTDASGGVLWVLTAADADAILSHESARAAIAMEVLKASGIQDGPLHSLWSAQMFGKDGEAHRRLRQSVARRLTPRAIAAWQSAFEATSIELLSSWSAHGDAVVDGWATYAVPFPARAACVVLGVPQEDAELLVPLALRLVHAFGMVDTGEILALDDAAVTLVDYVAGHLAAGRAPEGTVLDALGRSAAELTTAERVAVAANLVFGGLDATAKALATGLALLLTHEEAWSRLVGDPAAWAPAAVNEVLRFSPPVAGVARQIDEPAVCRGVPLQRGQIVISSLDAVCRDRRAFEQPDRFDIGRDLAKQFAFGLGPHYCLGANLARAVLEVAFRHVAERFPAVRLAEAADDLPWQQNPVRGVVRLPLALPDEA